MSLLSALPRKTGTLYRLTLLPGGMVRVWQVGYGTVEYSTATIGKTLAGTLPDEHGDKPPSGLSRTSRRYVLTKALKMLD